MTYLLHTTHAARNGSRAGLGITMIQWALFMRSRAAQLQSELAAGEIPGIPANSTIYGVGRGEGGWSLFGTDDDGTVELPSGDTADSLLGALLNSTTTTESGNAIAISPSMAQAMRMSSAANEWLAYALMLAGWLLVLSSVFAYLRAVRWAAAIRRSTAGASEESENAAPVIIIA